MRKHGSNTYLYKETVEYPCIYPGVRDDLAFVSQGMHHAADFFPINVIIYTTRFSYFVIDLPCSFVTDTIALPYDIYATRSKPPTQKTEKEQQLKIQTDNDCPSIHKPQ